MTNYVPSPPIMKIFYSMARFCLSFPCTNFLPFKYKRRRKYEEKYNDGLKITCLNYTHKTLKNITLGAYKFILHLNGLNHEETTKFIFLDISFYQPIYFWCLNGQKFCKENHLSPDIAYYRERGRSESEGIYIFI